MAVIGVACVTDCRILPVMVGDIEYLAARFDVDVVTQGAIQLAAIMDAIAARVPAGFGERVYAWPVGSVSPPAAVVGYPDEPIDFDFTFGRGSDHAVIPLYAIVGKPTERTARDTLSALLTGANGFKNAIDGELTS